MPLVDHPEGDYRFLPGIAPYSCGVVAKPGFEIVHAIWDVPLEYREGMERISLFLRSVKRPLAALCAVELRSPAPMSFEEFSALNADYAGILQSWGLFVDGANPVARTNVAPVYGAPKQVVLHGFSYTRPVGAHSRRTFVVAGGGELPEGKLDAESIVARGDLSENGLLQKATFVIGLMRNRLRALGVDWPAVTATNLYTRHPLDQIVRQVLATELGSAWNHGLRWHVSDPPVREIEFEMDLRGVVHEFWQV